MPFKLRFATVLCAFALISAGCGLAAAQTPPNGAALPVLNGLFAPLPPHLPVPSLLLRDTNGLEIPLQSILAERGGKKGTLLHLWSPLCSPCRAEMRELEAARLSLNLQGYEILAVAEDPNGLVTVPAFARRYGIRSLPLYIDAESRARAIMQPQGLPTTYLIAPPGNVVGVHVGTAPWIQGALPSF